MKELKYNIRFLLNKKELYYCILGVFLINAVHVFMVINHYASDAVLKTAEYQFILYNSEVTITTLLILAVPILTSLILADTSWNDEHIGYNNFLKTRMNIKKNIWIRMFLSIMVTSIICFIGFMLNYITLCFIFGSGNLIIHFQSLPYHLVLEPEFFLDNIRYTNPVLFAVLISMHEAFIFGLLSAVSYTLSFFTKQKLVVYFQVILFMILIEVAFSFLGIGGFSIIKQLQPFSMFTIWHSIVLYAVLLMVSIMPLVYITRKGDVL